VSETLDMAQHEATRTLVKSQPEVWTQCSDPDSLGRHLSGSFGEIRITRLEPEHSVAWEGEQVSGTVKIEPSAWGTRVTMAVQVEGESESVPLRPPGEPPAADLLEEEAEEPPAEEPPAQEEAEEAAPEAGVKAEPDPPRGRWGRIWGRLRRPPQPVAVADMPTPEPLVEPEPSAAAPVPPEPEPPQPRSEAAEALNAALESLGQAHHRPFSRG
jgi:hypothetical protein